MTSEPIHEDLDPPESALAEAETELAADLEAITPRTIRAAPGARRIRLRPVLGSLAIVVGILVVWEGAKWLGGDPCGIGVM